MILNLTQHPATPDQLAGGVFDIGGKLREAMLVLLTFDDIPTPMQIGARALALTEIACELRKDHGFSRVMIGGAPWLMSSLEVALIDAGFIPVYAFSKRIVIEDLVNGAMIKKSVFKHLGFYEQPSILDDALIKTAIG